MTDRLVSNHPEVHRALEALEPATKMRVATRIVLWAINEVEGDSNGIAELLLYGDHASLERLYSETEEQYFYFLERDDDQSVAWFSKARAYSASVFLERNELEDAVYESIFATQKPLKVSDFL